VKGAVGFGVFSEGTEPPRVGFRTGQGIVDLAAAGLGAVFEAGSLNAFMALGRAAWEDTVARVDELVTAGAELVPPEVATTYLPFEVADYVDFYSSLEHATNLGRLFRPDAEPLLPNWRHLPVGYHGRAGTVVVSGTPVVRPCGQTTSPQEAAPRYGPSRRLDIELELGFVVGVGSRLGEPVPASAFRDRVFGVVLVNDWSARDIQAWEYQPLGPFLGKSFATSIAAWVTPLALLEDRFVTAPAQDPEPFPYLRVDGDWALDVELEVELSGTVVSHTSARGLYWTMPQQLAHATVNGASIRTGDLFASGTISGSEPGSEGSLIELTWNGERPVRLADGSQRTFLEDGDEVVLRGRAGAVELAEVRGTVQPARDGGNEPAR
jgi:fumarylacetoacetase